MRTIAAVLIGLCVSTILSMSKVMACVSEISERKVFVVNESNNKVLLVHYEDLLEIDMSNPNDSAESAESTVQIEMKNTDGDNIGLAYEVPNYKVQGHQITPHIVQIRILDEGETDLILKTLDKNGQVLREVRQKIQARLRPKKRCP